MNAGERAADALSGAEPGGCPAPYRILVTGSRAWADRNAVRLALEAVSLDGLGREMVVVHGTPPSGAELIADYLARQDGFAVELWPAGLDAEMVSAGADVCLAFTGDSPQDGACCADLAEAAGIPVRRYSSAPR